MVGAEGKIQRVERDTVKSRRAQGRLVRGKLKVWFTGLAHLWSDRLTTLKSYTKFDRGDVNGGRKKHHHHIIYEQSEALQG